MRTVGPTRVVLAFLPSPCSQCSVVFLARTLPGWKMQTQTQIPSGCFTASKSSWMGVSSRKG